MENTDPFEKTMLLKFLEVSATCFQTSKSSKIPIQLTNAFSICTERELVM